MFWFDWMSLGIVVGVAIIQTVRTGKAGGMGLTLFEAAGLVAAAVGATGLAGSLAQVIGVQPVVMLIVLFLIFAVLAFIFAHWLFGVTGWSFESLDGLLGFFWGVAAGWVIAHMVLRIVIMSQGENGAVAEVMANAPIAREIYSFRTWNALMALLFKARLGPEFNPDVN
ncbi:MAG: hypothetical protein ABIK22_00230 [candidate division WOR-3 bacterium]